MALIHLYPMKTHTGTWTILLQVSKSFILSSLHYSTSTMTRKSLICELLTIYDDRLAMQKNKSDSGPLVRCVSPKMVGTTLDARVACLEDCLITRIQFQLYLAKKDNAIVKRLRTVHWTGSVRWHIDKADYRTIFVVRSAGKDWLDCAVLRRLIVNGPLVGTPHNLFGVVSNYRIGEARMLEAGLHSGSGSVKSHRQGVYELTA